MVGNSSHHSYNPKYENIFSCGANSILDGFMQ